MIGAVNVFWKDPTIFSISNLLPWELPADKLSLLLQAALGMSEFTEVLHDSRNALRGSSSKLMQSIESAFTQAKDAQLIAGN